MGAHIATGFRAVDLDEDADRYVVYLDAQGSTTFWQERKRESVDALRLRPGDAGLDIGCGTGAEVRTMLARVARLGGGRAVGVDASRTLIAEAQRRSAPGDGTEFVVADAHALPFAAASFDGVRTERTLQHVAEPAAVVAEMARVTRPGGRIVAIEPDWSTLVIDAAPTELSELFARAWISGVRNPRVGGELAGLFREAGLERVAVTPVAWLMREFAVADQQFDIAAVAHAAVAGGDIAADNAAAWFADVRAREARGEFLATVTYFVVVAVT